MSNAHSASVTSPPSVRTLLDDFAKSLPARTVAHGQAIHAEQTPADRIFLVRQGEVRLYHPGPDGSSRLVKIMGPGDWFGIPAVAGMACFEKRAVAVTATVVVEIPVQMFLASLQQSPATAIDFIRELAQRVHLARKECARLVFDDCSRRMIKTLIDFSTTAAASRLEGDDVLLRITHQQLAQAIGVARETVSVELTKLRRQNLVRTGRSKLVFNPTVLRERVNGGVNGVAKN
jgi:CRP/FNR family transcriptional regulator, cyclic AMP receptor protein